MFKKRLRMGVDPEVIARMEETQRTAERFQEQMKDYEKIMEKTTDLVQQRMIELRVAEARDEVLSAGVEKLMTRYLNEADTHEHKELLLEFSNLLAELIKEADKEGEAMEQFLSSLEDEDEVQGGEGPES